MKNTLFILFVSIIFSSMLAQEISGKWSGVLKVPGAQLRLVLNVSKKDSQYVSTLDSPDQGAKGIPVTTTFFEKPVLKITVANLKIEYEGRLNDAGTIEGNFKQAGQSFPLTLLKTKE